MRQVLSSRKCFRQPSTCKAPRPKSVIRKRFFAAPTTHGWRVRYFAPAIEVPFCGHATFAFGAALAMTKGIRFSSLNLSNAVITVEGWSDANGLWTAPQSPPTHSEVLDTAQLIEAMSLFNLTAEDTVIPPALISAGSRYFVVSFKQRSRLAVMDYDIKAKCSCVRPVLLLLRSFMRGIDGPSNTFASGGVFEDPATGAATAAFGGYLRDIRWPHGGSIDIVQGEDMGMRSLIHAHIPGKRGSWIRVSGSVRIIA
jgi:PhzF family phenazine biosynthesis protein